MAETITMRREDYHANQEKCEHAGLMLERGFADWNTEEYNKQKTDFYDKLVKIKTSDFYHLAYQRWQDHLFQQTSSSQSWAAKLEGRLYLGLGEASPLESAITLHHTYGVPFIPGSAIKGVLHHALLAEFKNNLTESNQQIIDTLFGREPDTTDKLDRGDAGYIIFNDAWWIPDSKKTPLVKEIITVHHQEYYKGEGAAATDFDSPNPNPQLAIRGSFLFSVEGEANWAKYTIGILKQVLENKGIGAKTASGYGYFSEDKVNQKEINDNNFDSASPEEKTALKVAELTLKNLPEKLGKQRNTTKDEVGSQDWPSFIAQVKSKFSEEIKGWGGSGKNQVKAYKTIMGEWTPTWEAEK